MKAQRNYPICKITAKGEAALLSGHPWVYDTEILSMANPAGMPENTLENGGLVDITNQKGRYLGTGLFSEQSKIRLRLISRNANDRFDESFWRRKLQWAWDYRKSVMPSEDLDCCRIIFGEADAFPGLTVDKFHDLLSVQILSVGMEQRKKILLPLLIEILQADGFFIRGIFERNDVNLRDKEGLPKYKGWFLLKDRPIPDSPVVEITENKIHYLVDLENGQKTGFFLDQKYNRQAVARIARGRTVLDCFTHTGSFALNAAVGGAKHVTAVDISENAISLAQEHVCRNHFEEIIDCKTANIFELLPKLESGSDPDLRRWNYDMIILDPPAFTKSRKTIQNAMSGYKEINYRAMRLLPRGGYLATCSCSHFAEESRFLAMLHSAARDAGVQLRQIEARQQSCDHPILIGVPETAYLKFFLFQVI